jgi:UDP-N-acetylglucosamine--N-acetylmuramyl-(pentapeptide) pyrophosphoryl-undecaprenol N-acetylglucosamine transferase
VLTGNPVRKFQISNFKFQIDKDNKRLPLLYVTGGSAGSHYINVLVEGCIRQLLEKFIVIHQTGDAQEYHDFDHLQKLSENLPPELKSRYIITKFVKVENVGLVINMADLVVSRAGINTITELFFFNKPSLLIPLPASQKNDQLKNAFYLKNLGLAEVLQQGKQDSGEFLRLIELLFDNKDKYKAKYKLEAKIHTNAADKIIEAIEYAKRTNKD